jgi:hypothetical protein
MTPINTKNRAGDGIHLSKKPAGFWPVENTNRKLKTVKTGTVLSPVTGRLATLITGQTRFFPSFSQRTITDNRDVSGTQVRTQVRPWRNFGVWSATMRSLA